MDEQTAANKKLCSSKLGKDQTFKNKIKYLHSKFRFRVSELFIEVKITDIVFDVGFL